jgi:hypothetical protein
MCTDKFSAYNCRALDSPALPSRSRGDPRGAAGVGRANGGRRRSRPVAGGTRTCYPREESSRQLRRFEPGVVIGPAVNEGASHPALARISASDLSPSVDQPCWETAIAECGCRKRTHPNMCLTPSTEQCRQCGRGGGISPCATRPDWQLLPADANRAGLLVPELRRRPDRPHSVQFPSLSL